MDDVLIGKGPASLDVEDYQEEQGWKVEEEEDHYWKDSGRAVQGKRGLISTESQRVLRGSAETPVEVFEELIMNRVAITQGTSNRAKHHAGDG